MTVLPAFEQAGQSFCVPSMALILLVQVQSRVFTVKCSGQLNCLILLMSVYSRFVCTVFQICSFIVYKLKYEVIKLAGDFITVNANNRNSAGEN